MYIMHPLDKVVDTMYKIFIDGKEGTTGLRIFDRLALRSDIEVITLQEELRKDASARKQALNSCDIAFLCLPDAAAIEAAAMVENPAVRIIDTSTAHRTDPDWVYGLPELSKQQNSAVENSARVAVPGCHAGGFVTLAAPLVANGLLPKDALLTCHSVTGYSGGGKKMIAQYESDDRSALLGAPRQYGITQQHKHLREMKVITGLDISPIFCPIVSDFYSGMVTTVPLFASQLNSGYGVEDIKALYKSIYTGPVIEYAEDADEGGFISGAGLSGLDKAQVSVFGNDERILLVNRFDNLGKGASGAAIECMNIMLGLDKTMGLDL